VYRVGGIGVQASESFVVDGASAQYMVDVHRTASRAQRVGTGLLGGGVGSLVVGALFLGVALATANDSCSGYFCIPTAPMAGAVAAFFGGIGMVLSVTGGAMLASSPEPTPTTVRRVAVGLTKTF
jgi:hypothetical protein